MRIPKKSKSRRQASQIGSLASVVETESDDVLLNSFAKAGRKNQNDSAKADEVMSIRSILPAIA